MVKYEASHGTTKKRAELIRKQGFLIGKGRYGGGVYFWRKSPYFEKLAIGWFNDCLSKGNYNDELEPICAIIIANLVANDDEVLNLDDPLLKERIADIAYKRKINQRDKGKIASLFETFIRSMEKELNVAFKIILRQAAPPESCRNTYPIIILGAPDCCIAKDVSCIKIKQIIIGK